jgi:hypothetical protein
MYFVCASPNILLAMRPTDTTQSHKREQLTPVGDQLARRVGEVNPSVR